MEYPIEITTKKEREIYSYFLKAFTEQVAAPTNLNKQAIASYAVAYIEMMTLRRFLKKNGYTYGSKNVMGTESNKARPEVKMLDSIEGRMLQMRIRLGFYNTDVESAASSPLDDMFGKE